MKSHWLYGCVAEFKEPTQVVEAAQAARRAGYRRFEVYSPYHLKQLGDTVPAIDPIPFLVFCAGAVGAISAWVMMWYITCIDFPINIGGRPLYSWPSYIPITFELTVLFAAVTAFVSTLTLCGFPLPHHPLFSVPRFAHATNDRFFLCIESRDRKFNRDTTRNFLLGLNPMHVWEVENE